MTLDVEVVALGGGLIESRGRSSSSILAAVSAREAGSPMLASLALADRVRIVSAGEPVGKRGRRARDWSVDEHAQ